MMKSRPATAAVTHPDVEITGAETAFERFLQMDVFHFRHRLFSGEWSDLRSYDVLRRGPAVAIVLYDPDRDMVVLVEQFRLPALLAGSSPWQIEAAAGLIDSGEAPNAVAIRETREETGLALICEPIPIQRYLPSSGGSDESVFLFCGRVDAAAAAGVHGLVEEHEDIRVVVKPWAEIEAMLDAGAIESGHTLIALYWLARHRDRLRRLWAPETSSATVAAMSEEKISLELLGSRVLALMAEVRDLQQRFTAIESRLTALESRFSAMEQRFAVQEERMTAMLGLIVRIAERVEGPSRSPPSD
jgi:ADP-ribose pyrophosphatase